MQLLPTAPAALAELRRREAGLLRSQLAPPPKLTVSQWADDYRYLSPEASAEPGKWNTDRAPYARAMMDAFSDPLCEEVVGECASQTTKTEIINNVVGYFVDQDPAPILVVEPTLETAKAWSLDRLAPMLRDTPRLRNKVRDPKTRDSGNTIQHKSFAGGHITIVGANSAAGLAMRPIRVALFDEVDRYPASAGSEGDPVDLGKKRTTTFWNRKIGLFSSPTDEASRIHVAYLNSSQGRFEVPCPHCGQMQVLVFAGLKWESDRPETAQYVCGRRDEEGRVVKDGGCGALIDESFKHRMLAGGRWAFSNPGQRRVMGFHISALYSPWVQWREIARTFLEVRHERERLKAFTNTTLAEIFKEPTVELKPEDLGARREEYVAEVPAPAGVLTAGVDVQGDRLELLVRGWGIGEESWGLRHLAIHGDPAQDAVWEQLERELTRTWAHELGAPLRIRCVCIDSGDQTEDVYRFVRARQARGVFATKGKSQETARPLVTKPSPPNRAGVRLWTLGVDAGKVVLFDRLGLQQPGPGYLHFAKSFPDDYFQQFGAEKMIRRMVHGQVVKRFRREGSRRNEAIDLEVLALAALHILGPTVREHLPYWVEKVRKEGEALGGPRRQPPPPPPEEGDDRAFQNARRPRPPTRPRGGWAKRF